MRTRKTTIVLISGKAGSGKTTLKNILYAKLGELEGLYLKEYSFASPLKYMAKAFLGWNEEKDDRGRKLLQNLGKVGREYDESIWVKHMLNQLDKTAGVFPFNFVLIDDWRFPDELKFLRENPIFDIITIRVIGRGGLEGENANDASELSLPETIIEDLHNSVEHTFSDGNKASEIYNYVIDNSGNLENLTSKVDIILPEIRKQYIVE